MPSTPTQAAQHNVTNTNSSADPSSLRTRWFSRRGLPKEDVTTTSIPKQRRSNKRARSVSPEPQDVSASTSTTNKRRRSLRLQADKAGKGKSTTKPQSLPRATPQASGSSSSTDRKAPSSGRSTTAKAPTRSQVANSRQKDRNEAPGRLTRRRSQRLVSAHDEETTLHDHDHPAIEHEEKPPQEPLSPQQSNSSSPEKTRATIDQSDLTRTYAISDSTSTTTVVNFHPKVQCPVFVPQGEYIDFGTLVPEGRKNNGKSINLRFVDDGSSATRLTVGGSDECDVKLEGEYIDDVHGSIELLLRFDHGNYQRVVLVHPSKPQSVTIIPQYEDSFRLQATLQEGCSVRFGTNNRHRYRYVLPQQPLPDPPCWATRIFTWDPETKPIFGGPRCNSSVYLVRKLDSNTRHAMKVVHTARFSFNPALQEMVRREHVVLSLLNHPHVVQLQNFRRDDVHSRIIFVFPEMNGGNLFDFVMRNRKSQNQRHLSDFAPRVAKGLLSGLKHIHSNNIVHRDLKPENVLLAEDVLDLAPDSLRVVIGDFGIARLPGEKRTETYLGGSCHWFSPVSFRDPEKARTDFPIDLWGMALIVWFMLAGPPKPWGEVGEPRHPKETNQLPWDQLEDLNITDECIDFLDGFLVDNPGQCRTIEQTEQHPWILNGVTVNTIETEDSSTNVEGLVLPAAV